MARPSTLGHGLTAAVVVALTIAGAVFVNMLAGAVVARVDLTDNQVNSLSDASIEAARALEDVEVRVYISANLPETVRHPDTGREVALRDVVQKFTDKLEEYRTQSEGALRIVRVTDDVLDAADKAKVRPIAGDQASATDSGLIEFERYVVGASFHYKSAMETLELALDPEYLEFEVTKILLRLDEKVKGALLMKDVLRTGESLYAAFDGCRDAIQDAAPDEDAAAANPFGLLSAEEGKARVEAYRAGAESFAAACKALEDEVAKAEGSKGKHEPLDVLVETVKAYADGWGVFRGALNDDPEVVGEVGGDNAILQVAPQLESIGVAVDDANDDLVDSPGRKRIGVVCSGLGFCPFPSMKPLVPQELAGMLAQQNPFAGQILPQLQQMEQQINQTMSSVERGLFRQQGFDIVRVDLDQEDAIPADVGALVLFGPKRALDDWALYQIDQFVMRGGSLVVFLNAWDVKLYHYTPEGEMTVLGLDKNSSNIGDLLAHWGLKPNGDLVAEPEAHDFVTVPAIIQQGQFRMRTQKRFDYPMLPVLTRFDDDSPLVRSVSSLTLPFTSSVTLTDVPGVTTEALVMTSADANSTTSSTFPLEPGAQLAAVTEDKAEGEKVVVATASGTLPSFFAGKDAPRAPADAGAGDDEETGDEGDDDAPKDIALDTPDAGKKLDQGTGRVLVVGSNLGLEPLSVDSVFEGFNPTDLGDSQGGMQLIEKFRGYGATFQNWQVGVSQLNHTLQDNLPFMFNVMDWSTQQEALVAVRSKQYVRRPLDPLDEDGQSWVAVQGVALAPGLFVVLGVALGMLRRRRRQSLKV